MQQTFDTPAPIEMYVEVGRGRVRVRAVETTRTEVRIEGRHAEQVELTHEGDRLSLVAPKVRTGFFGSDPELVVDVDLPTGSTLVTKLGAADLVVEGTLEALRSRTGSGDVTVAHVTGAAVLDTGSGDIDIARTDGDLRIKSGSGDITVAHAAHAGIATGSGDVRIRQAQGAVSLKAGSGDLRIDHAGSDVDLTTGSGDLVVGRFDRGSLVAKTATGDVAVGVAAGVPVWTDISSITGRISSTLTGAGQPEPGQDHIELRVTTVSGDVRLQDA